MAGFATVNEGGIEVDSNVGTVAELQAEIATETAKPGGTGRAKAAPVVEPARPVVADLGATAASGETTDAGAAEGAEAEGEQAPAAGAAAVAKPKVKKSLQARINDLRADLGNTARERDASRAEITRLTGELQALKNPDAAKKGEYAGVPFTEKEFPRFATYLETHPDAEIEDWSRADRRWEAAKERAELDTVQAARAARTAPIEIPEQHRATEAKYFERMAPALEKDPQFYEKIDKRLTETPALEALPGLIKRGDLPKDYKPTLANFFVSQVLRSDVPDALLQHLSDEKVVRRLATLPPDAIIREIAKFELTIERPAGAVTGPSADEQDDDESSEASTRSEAAPPVKPVRGSSQQSHTGDEEPGDDASDDAWAKWYKKDAAKKRKAS